MESREFQDLVRRRVETLRPKLLDLSRRNPLVATRLTPRSAAHIRVVDEVPDNIFSQLGNGAELRIVSLPELDEDPKDESTKKFSDALANAQLTDETYLRALESVDEKADDFADRTRIIERELRDRLRGTLKMPERPQKADTNLSQHARNNGIQPSYELPAEGSSDRHDDDDVQTLLLPKDLERKLNGISSKCKTWIQETGINVLHIAYGFVEWSEPNQTETSLAPLVLSAIQIEKQRTSGGPEFTISATGEEAELNTVFAEKLKEYSIELPDYDGGPLEPYFADVAALEPKGMTWKFRRQIAIGVFPSARMAMYHDLDPDHPLIAESEIVGKLLAGSQDGAAIPFAEDYHVDQPSIEKLVPYRVLDADSSQYSALVDIASNKNLAIEGPPGTGKSQTIVNAIAAALASGKKVLFVAEKLAALNVVKSRLEAIGLGEFLLPLQAERSTREQVIASLRTRVEMARPANAKDFDDEMQKFSRIRSELADYINLLTSPFAETGLTVHDILGKSIATAARLESIPLDVLSTCSIAGDALTRTGLQNLRDCALRVERMHQASSAAGPSWRGIKLTNIDRFTVEDICNTADRASQLHRRVAELRAELPAFGLDENIQAAILLPLAVSVDDLFGIPEHDRAAALQLLDASRLSLCSDFITDLDAAAKSAEHLASILTSDVDRPVIDDLSQMAELCRSHDIGTLHIDSLEQTARERRDALQIAASLIESIKPLVALRQDAASWPFDCILLARQEITRAGRSALSLRSETLANPAARDVLVRLIQDCRALQATRSNLASRVALDIEASPEELRELVTTLASSNFLSFLMGSYRNAVRRARLIVPSQSFNKPLAIGLLNELAAFRVREREFMRNPQAAAVFGLLFRGIDTEPEPFERLLAFYGAIDSELTSPDKRGVGQFLREARLDELDLIPNVPTGIRLGNSETLQSDLTQREAELAATNDAIDRLRTLVSHLRHPGSVLPIELAAMSAQADSLLSLREKLDGATAVAALIGRLFSGSRSSPRDIECLCAWSRNAQPHAQAVVAVMAGERAHEASHHIRILASAQNDANSSTMRLAELSHLPASHFTSDRGFAEVATALLQASQDSDGLFAHSGFAGACRELGSIGVERLIDHRLSTGTDLVGIAVQVDALAARTLARQLYATHGTLLGQFSGAKLDELRSALAQKDRELVKLSRKKLQRKIYDDAKPPYGIGAGRRSTWTNMALIENEIAKQKRFVSVRDLTERAGSALLELKPCWMMSPLAVAQYVQKGELTFDLCIIDEASQMPPEAAIGALLRCKQTVVVGDTNQLPPSSFFRKMIDDEEVDEDDAVLNESILEMANATFRPARRLRWHYRSRHSGLIQFSNRMIYDDGLVVFPSATEAMSHMGVVLKSVDGLYKAGTNPVEARAVVDAIIEFMRTDPDRSLGVVTLNQKQRDLIHEEFEFALARDSAAQAYVDRWRGENDGLEDFFIKNLENVQGDERDVIFIGTVYGPESRGARVAQRFGPINGVAGRRRLNVLFSRAKEKIVTFSSMTASDILAEEGGNAGVYMLKRWLEYSAMGRLDAGITTPREPESDFEVFVIEQIKSMGLIPVPQVGVAGYFIDIGIRHPNWSHGFVLGVECDGASYHSAKSARDRDRLRQEILENLGWKLHRIWSTDWFNNPRREAERLRAVVEDRMKELRVLETDMKVSEPADELSELNDETSEESSLGDAVVVKMPDTDMSSSVEIGDTVRVRYLTDDRKTLQVTISRDRNDSANGLIHHEMPVAQALLGASEGDEIEILVGSYVRSALVEAVYKAKMGELSSKSI